MRVGAQWYLEADATDSAVFLHVTLWKQCCCGCVWLVVVLSAAAELASCMTGRVPCSIGVPGSPERVQLRSVRQEIEIFYYGLW